MKKVGLLTLYENNYGSALQSYAMKYILWKLGYDCYLIDEKLGTDNSYIKKFGKALRLVYRSLRYKGYYTSWKSMRNAMVKEQNLISKESAIQLDRFIKNELQPKVYKHKEILQVGRDKTYHAFIVGSDQVWNASRDIPDKFFLRFAPRDKRLAYAASFGVAAIPKFNIKYIKKELKKFREISVREESGQYIVHEIIGKSCCRVPDPVVLIEENDWRVFYGDCVIVSKDYILAQFLSEPNNVAIEALNYVSKKLNISVICFAYHHTAYSMLEKGRYFDGGVKEYLALIDNAKYVFTDSFHTCMFSIIFKKKFFVFDRQYLHLESQNSRIDDLINRYDIQQCKIDSIDEITRGMEDNIPSNDVFLNKERQNGIKFIKEALYIE